MESVAGSVSVREQSSNQYTLIEQSHSNRAVTTQCNKDCKVFGHKNKPCSEFSCIVALYFGLYTCHGTFQMSDGYFVLYVRCNFQVT